MKRGEIRRGERETDRDDSQLSARLQVEFTERGPRRRPSVSGAPPHRPRPARRAVSPSRMTCYRVTFARAVCRVRLYARNNGLTGAARQGVSNSGSLDLLPLSCPQSPRIK